MSNWIDRDLEIGCLLVLEGYSCVNLMTSFISSINNLCLKIGENRPVVSDTTG